MKKLMNLIMLSGIVIGMRHLESRSPFRLEDVNLPRITIFDDNQNELASLSHRHLSWYPTFFFTIPMLTPFLLPDAISYQNNQSRWLSKERIDAIIQGFINELDRGLKKFSEVTLLQAKNFNFKKRCGLIVVKCKNHPFVIKLFMERPETYFDPYCKGVESIAFFFAAGGVNRHCAGLSRIINLHQVASKIALMPQWAPLINFPRKWLWLPPQPTFLHFKGYNLADHGKVLENKIPEVFAVIADEVNTRNNAKIRLRRKKQIIMNLCNDLALSLDPHVPNFVFQKSATHPFSITVLDTEHFPTMINLHQPPRFSNYVGWYSYLVVHFFEKTLLRGKKREMLLSQIMFDTSQPLSKG